MAWVYIRQTQRNMERNKMKPWGVIDAILVLLAILAMLAFLGPKGDTPELTLFCILVVILEIRRIRRRLSEGRELDV